MRVREVVPSDLEFLWLMLFYASHSNDEPGVTPEDIRVNPDLIRYLDGWGRRGDLGVIAVEMESPVGAAWVRLIEESKTGDPSFIDSETPELAVAVRPGWEGLGVGTEMLTHLFEIAADSYPGIGLSVRVGNPAVALYERLGFRVVGRITNRVGTESLKMHVKLH